MNYEILKYQDRNEIYVRPQVLRCISRYPKTAQIVFTSRQKSFHTSPAVRIESYGVLFLFLS